MGSCFNKSLKKMSFPGIQSCLLPQICRVFFHGTRAFFSLGVGQTSKLSNVAAFRAELEFFGKLILHVEGGISFEVNSNNKVTLGKGSSQTADLLACVWVEGCANQVQKPGHIQDGHRDRLHQKECSTEKSLHICILVSHTTCNGLCHFKHWRFLRSCSFLIYQIMQCVFKCFYPVLQISLGGWRMLPFICYKITKKKERNCSSYSCEEVGTEIKTSGSSILTFCIILSLYFISALLCCWKLLPTALSQSVMLVKTARAKSICDNRTIHLSIDKK